jgi:riboflavin biosynthesis pyrimidine reductase
MSSSSQTGAIDESAGHDGRMRRLLPDPADDITVDEAYGSPLASPPGRSWVGLCMVASIDGSIAVDGTSGGLSSPNDVAVLTRLRRLADVVVVGAGTIRDEGYGAPQKPGQRIGIVTRSGGLDYDSDIFSSGAGFLITTETGAPDVPGGVDVIRAGADEVDLALALEQLAAVAGCADYVQLEGGAALNGAMLDADLIDEINLTTSPATFGGPGPRLATGAPPHAHRFEVAQLAIDDESFVYTRWLRRRD